MSKTTVPVSPPLYIFLKGSFAVYCGYIYNPSTYNYIPLSILFTFPHTRAIVTRRNYNAYILAHLGVVVTFVTIAPTSAHLHTQGFVNKHFCTVVIYITTVHLVYSL